VRIARIVAHAENVFSAKPDYARELLRAAQRELAGRTPLHALTNVSGAHARQGTVVTSSATLRLWLVAPIFAGCCGAPAAPKAAPDVISAIHT
jgi:hypothetical protein